MSYEKFTVSNGERDYEFTTSVPRVQCSVEIRVLNVNDVKTGSNNHFTYFIRDNCLLSLDSLLPVYHFLSQHNLQPDLTKLGLLSLDDFLKRYFSEVSLVLPEAMERGQLVLMNVDRRIYAWFVYRQLEYLSRNDPGSLKRHFDENLLNLIDLDEGVWYSEFLPSLQLYREACASRTEFLDKCFEIWGQVENLDIKHNHLGDQIIRIIVRAVADIKRLDLQSKNDSLRQLVRTLVRLALD